MALLLSSASAQAAKAATTVASTEDSEGSVALAALFEDVNIGEADKPEKRKAEELHGGGVATDQPGADMAERLAAACASVSATIAARSLQGANREK